MIPIELIDRLRAWFFARDRDITLQAGRNIDTSGGTVNGVDVDAFNEATFVTISASAYMPNERVLTAGDGLDLTDGGAGSTATLDVDVTDFIDTTAGLTEDGANNIQVNLAAPSGLSFSAGALQVDDSVAGVGLDIAAKVLSVNKADIGLDAQFVVLAAEADLDNERVLTAGDGLDLTDGGAGSTATLDVDVTDFIDTSAGLTEDGANNIQVNLGVGLSFGVGGEIDGHLRLHGMNSALDHTATAWRVFHSDGSGNVQELGFGVSGSVLQSTGTASTPTFDSLNHGDLTGIGENDHHSRLHGMNSALDHAATAWRIFYSDGSGNVQELGFGTSGQHLRSNGAAAAPDWVTAPTVPAHTSDGSANPSTPLESDPSGDLYLRRIVVDDRVVHDDDTDTYLEFTPDQAVVVAGGVTLLTATESTQDVVTLGDGSDVDLNFNNAAFIEGSSGNMVVGGTSPIGGARLAVISTADAVMAIKSTGDTSAGRSLNLQFHHSNGEGARIGAFRPGGVSSGMIMTFYTQPTGGSLTERMVIARTGEIGFSETSPGSVAEISLATENLEIVDAGSAGATEQDWIEVQVGGATGYLRVYSSR